VHLIYIRFASTAYNQKLPNFDMITYTGQ